MRRLFIYLCLVFYCLNTDFDTIIMLVPMTQSPGRGRCDFKECKHFIWPKIIIFKKKEIDTKNIEIQFNRMCSYVPIMLLFVSVMALL